MDGPPRAGRIGRAAATLDAGDAPAPAEPVEEAQFERLRAWRLGRAEGKPAYTVATDAALAETLRAQPRTIEALLAIRGIGPAFCEKHGESLLSELAAM